MTALRSTSAEEPILHATSNHRNGSHKSSSIQRKASSIRQLRPAYQLAIACIIALLISQTAIPRLTSGLFHRSRSSRIGQSRSAQIFITRSGQDGRSDVWLSLLQALSKARFIRTTIVDTPYSLDKGKSSSIMERDISLQHLAKSLVWRNKPYTESVKNSTSIEEWIERLGDGRNVLLTTSCARDLVDRQDLYIQLLEKTNVILYCTVDDAEPFLPNGSLSNAIIPWADQSRLRYISLGDQVGHLLADGWAASAPSITPRIFPPIFNVSNEVLEFSDVQMDIQLRLNNGNISLLQEDPTMNTTSTNYLMMNDALERFTAARILTKGESHRVASVKVAGVPGISNEVKKPKDLADESFRRQMNTSIISTLQVLATSAMVVTVASQKHLQALSANRSSSTIPLAIIAGVPPLVNEEILAAHSYLDKDAAIILSADDARRLQIRRGNSKSTESLDMMRAFEYFAVPYFQQYRKRHSVETLRTTLLVQNTHKLQSWILADTM